MVEIVKKAVQLCANAYDGKHGSVDFSGCSDIRKFRYNVTDGYTCLWKNYRVICFKGSGSTEDWIDNFTFVRRPFFADNETYVHAGFAAQYADVRNHVNAIAITEHNIIVCGHSLGGAIATLCAYDLKMHFPYKSIYCITCGSPRVGNIDFKIRFDEIFAGKSFRVVNGDDIVAKVPFTFFKYFHVGSKLQIGKRTIFGRIFGNKEDHRPEKYVENIRSIS